MEMVDFGRVPQVITVAGLVGMLIVGINVVDRMRFKTVGIKGWLFWFAFTAFAGIGILGSAGVHPLVAPLLPMAAWLMWKHRRRLEFDVASEDCRKKIKTEAHTDKV